MTTFSLRPFRPEDGPAWGQLLVGSPDTGRIHFTYHYRIDPYTALSAQQGDFLGVVAQVPHRTGLVGAGLVRFGRVQIEGALRPCALLNTLIVHPDFRRQGIATSLVQWRVQAARERMGDEGVIWALIQHGNVGSLRTVTKFLPQIIPDRLISVPMKMRSRRPRSVSGWRVRQAEGGDLAQVAEHMNRFYREYNFYEPQSADTLARWLAVSPFETPFRHYLLLTDAGGGVLAGAGVEESYRLGVLQVKDMSSSLRVVNAVLRLVPADGVSRSLSIAKAWYAPAQIQALRHLVDSIRWRWREQATMAVAVVDRQGPLLKAFALRPWTPSPRSSVVADSPVKLGAERLIAYN